MKILELLKSPLIQQVLIQCCKALLDILQTGKLPKDKADYLINQIQEIS